MDLSDEGTGEVSREHAMEVQYEDTMEVGDLVGGHLDAQVRRQMESREGMVNREQNRRTYSLDLYTTVYVFAHVCVENDIDF